MSPINAINTLSIKRKLMLIMMLTSCTAIILMALLVVFNQANNSQQAIQQQLITLADVLGATSTGALTFDDKDSGKEILSELKLESNIIYAVINRANGDVFAVFGEKATAYAFKSSQVTELSTPVWDNLFANEIYVVRDIYLENELIGKISIASTLDKLHEDLLNYAALLAMISAACFFVTFFICSRLQKVISEPIINLQNAMDSVSKSKDYSLRVENKEENEFGALIEGFNQMVQQIQIRDKRISEYNMHLQKIVETRTSQLIDANRKRILWL